MSCLMKRFLLACVCASLMALVYSGPVKAEVSAKYSVSGEEALNNLIKLAQEGNREDLYKLGIIYLTGNGAPVSKKDAIRCIRAASQLGLPQAQVLVAASYAIPSLFDVNVQPQDLPAIRFLLQKAGVTLNKGAVDGIKDKFAARMLAYLDLLGVEGLSQGKDAEVEKAHKNAAAIFEKLGISEADYKVPEGETFRQVFEKGLEQAYGLELRDGKAVSFDDANYPK